MSWPTPQEYNEAIQTPLACFSDDALKFGSVSLNALGLPRASTGAFASVYKVTGHGSNWAVRCFLNHRHEQKERYTKISDFVVVDDLECTVPFHYLDRGIKVKGTWYPILKMDWVEGDTLDIYIRDNFKNSQLMRSLRDQFRKLAAELERAGIAHGDLQHGNIIVTKQGLRLVDYDALYVPALLGMKSLELGHPNYQHPDRNEFDYDTTVDNFSCWLIDTALLAIILNPELYNEFHGDDDCILFKRSDLKCPERSELFATLLNHEDEELAARAHLLLRMLWSTPQSIPELSANENELDLLLLVKPGSAETITGDHGEDGSLTDTHHRVALHADETELAFSTTLAKRTRQKKQNTALNTIWKTLKEKSDQTLRTIWGPGWVELKLSRADQHFSRGHYEAALELYLHVFNFLESPNEKYHLPYARTIETRMLQKALIRSGCCHAILGSHKLAHNCFLLSQAHAATSENPSEEQCRAWLHTAVNHYLNKQLNSCNALIEKLATVQKSLEEVVEQELKNPYFNSPRVFDFFCYLLEFEQSVQPSNQTQARTMIDIRIAVPAAMKVYDSLPPDSAVQTSRRALQLLVDTASTMLAESSEYINRIDVLSSRILKNENVSEALNTLNEPVNNPLDELILKLSRLQFPQHQLDLLKEEATWMLLATAGDEVSVLNALNTMDDRGIKHFVEMKQRKIRLIDLTCASLTPNFETVHEKLFSAIGAYSWHAELGEIILQLITCKTPAPLKVVLTELSQRDKEVISNTLHYLYTFRVVEELLLYAIENIDKQAIARIWPLLSTNHLDLDRLLSLAEARKLKASALDFILQAGSDFDIEHLIWCRFLRSNQSGYEILRRAQDIRTLTSFAFLLRRLAINADVNALVPMYLERIEISTARSKKASTNSQAGQLAVALCHTLSTPDSKHHLANLIRVAHSNKYFRARELLMLGQAKSP